MTAQPTFFWHDYETSGADPMRDRPLQFAGMRTDMDLAPVGDPVMLYCKPSTDCLPHPQATLITGITPQQAERDGVIEAEFAAAVHDELAMPGTCGVGYNSLRFDDSLTRHLLYRNFYDPYAREWQNGNSRWDIIDLARLCHALRPDGIAWPTRDDGSPSFKLEHLATANHLEQKHAHDALSDVEATIALARLLRTRQPRLWNWYFGLRRKQAVFGLLDVANMTPLLHVSSRYPASQGCLSMIAPLAMHPARNTEVIVANLDADPGDLIDLDADAIADRLFTPRADLPEGIERVGLRTVHVNKSPALAPLSVLKGTDTARIGLDVEQCLANAERLRGADGLAAKVREVYANASDLPPAEDPELALYGGFLPDADKPLLERVRATPPTQLDGHFPFRDPRYPELLFRYRARNWPDTLNAGEQARWEYFRRQRLTRETPLTTLTLDAYFAEIAALRRDPACSHRDQGLLDHLEVWGRDMQSSLTTAEIS
ncbi:MAG TPA: exodeoxyribonuclease I [Rhodanobacteraceae bacterium]|nr:exodeoxyribonuclease I [Rhodanobacteraceae bacterium]